MMEADETPQKDLNVYITVDPTSLQKYRNRRRVEPDHHDVLTEFIDYVVALEYKEYLATPLGVLMITEFLFVLTLLLMAAIAPSREMAYESGIYAIVVNSLNLLALILLLVLSCCWLAEIWKTRITTLLVLKIFIRGLMLVLHIVAFILQIANSRGFPVQIAFIVITMVYCCVLIVTIALLKEEYSRHATTRQTSGIAQKRKKSRPKRKEYKKTRQKWSSVTHVCRMNSHK